MSMSHSPTPSVTRSSTASSLTTLLTPSNPTFPPNIRIEQSDGGSATPTRDSFFPLTKVDPYGSLQLKRKPLLLQNATGLRRSVSASGVTRRAGPTLAMSIHAPSPSKPSPHRPSGHARRPSLSEVLLRDIVDRDDHRRGIHSSASSSKSEYEPQSRHRRRHSTSMHVPRSITPHTPTTPHGQVLQARLERVLHTASISSSSAESHKSPLFRSHSSSGHKRRTMSSRFEDDKAAPLTLHDKVAAWNLPSAPQLEGIEPVTTPPRRKRHSMFNTPPRLALQRPSLTASPRLHPSTPRSPSYGHHPPPASPFLRSTSPRLLLTTPPPTPPESPTEETSASDSSSSSTPPSESFDPHLASLQCRNMTGYVSFGEVEGLDAGRLCDGDIELKKGVQKGAWSWRLWS